MEKAVNIVALLKNSIHLYCKNLQNRFFNNAASSVNPSSTCNTTISFFCILAFYILYTIAKQGSWAFSGEMWAEMATNYYSNSFNANLFHKFFATDAGYIPLPQRIIAALGYYLGLTTSMVPYYYTWSAIICSALMIGSFSLAIFRPVINNDFVRAMTCVFVLILIDFETRTFVNFSYLSVFFIAILTTLAITKDADDAPIWAWFIPILVLSKPYAFTLCPLMLISIFSVKKRFQRIFAASLIVAVLQVLQLLYSQRQGVMASEAKMLSLSTKILATVKYFFSFLGGYTIGPQFWDKVYALGGTAIIGTGLISLLIIAATFRYRRNTNLAVIFVGVSLVFFTMLINSFALTARWDSSLQPLQDLPVYRHVISAFFGIILIILGLLQAWCNNKKYSFIAGLLLWSTLTGWLHRGVIMGNEPKFPVHNNSQWQLMAESIAQGKDTLCIPVDPFSWHIFQKNCRYLNDESQLRFPSTTQMLKKNQADFYMDVVVPKSVTESNLVAIGIPVKPLNQTTNVALKVTLTTTTGQIIKLSNEKTLPTSGGLILISDPHAKGYKDITSLQLISNVPIEIFAWDTPEGIVPAILWMGN